MSPSYVDSLLCALSSVPLPSRYPLSLLAWGQALSDPITSHQGNLRFCSRQILWHVPLAMRLFLLII
ncbi:hypothetical protein EYF80_016624 [Liparis tanakae]|uniref:Uncharacterized protein n=1 Tax=Liparis tanakae TaxID=230148 RepID=A0A4Z2I595_9TELE|nr:hypothetical protein EYF80_016624 [Liparis tanakae]